MSKTWDDDGGVQDDDGGAGDNNDVELSQWACDFPSFGKKRCFEANTLWGEHTATLIVTLIQTHSHAVFLRRCSVFWGVSSIQNTLVLLLFGRKSSLCVLWHLRYSELNKLEKGERGKKKATQELGHFGIFENSAMCRRTMLLLEESSQWLLFICQIPLSANRVARV